MVGEIMEITQKIPPKLLLRIYLMLLRETSHRVLEAHLITMLALTQLLLDLVISRVTMKETLLLTDASTLLVNAYKRDVSRIDYDCNLKHAVSNALAVFKKTYINIILHMTI